MPLEYWAGWALLGAFVYSAQRLGVALGEPKTPTSKPPSVLAAEFIMACVTGPIIGAGLGPIAFGFTGLKGEAEARGIALVVGMIANPLAPLIVKGATAFAARKIDNLGKDK